jgi:NADPH:quinone reductase-like Zn-dependent oxidoreductase
MAVQLAKALGLYVVGVAGPANVEWVKQLGADEVVDYSKQVGLVCSSASCIVACASNVLQAELLRS